MSRATPSVSVLLPVRDGGVHLEPAVRSILEQTFQDFELLLVDDGSRDGSGRVAADLARGDSRIRIIRNPSSLGIVAALERARLEARAPFLARMDADDLAAPDRFEAQIAAFRDDPGLVLVGCPVRYVAEGRIRPGARRYEGWLNGLQSHQSIERDLFVECPLAHPTFFFRAEAVASVGGYRDLGWPEDYDLVLRLWRTGGRFRRVDSGPLLWRDRESRLSRTDPRYSLNAFRRCKVHHLTPTLLREGRPVVVWGAGPTGQAFAKVLRAGGTDIVAFVDLDPRKVGQMIHSVPVLGPQDVRLGGVAVLAAVSGPGPRAEIRAELDRAGLVEGADYVAVA